MTPDLRRLFQDLLLEHYRHPRHAAPLAVPSATAEGRNPLCGDRSEVALRVERDRIADVSVRSEGCTICVATGSMLAERLAGATLAEAREELETVRRILEEGETPPSDAPELLRALAPLRDFPVRLKCALLPQRALSDAVEQAAEPRGA
jgi:nitrogen fixation NifU-like protein